MSCRTDQSRTQSVALFRPIKKNRETFTNEPVFADTYLVEMTIVDKNAFRVVDLEVRARLVDDLRGIVICVLGNCVRQPGTRIVGSIEYINEGIA